GVALSAGLLSMVASPATAGGPSPHLLRAALDAALSGRSPARVAALLQAATPSATIGKVKLLAVAVLMLGLHMHGAPPSKETVARANQVAEPEKKLERNSKLVPVS